MLLFSDGWLVRLPEPGLINVHAVLFRPVFSHAVIALCCTEKRLARPNVLSLPGNEKIQKVEGKGDFLLAKKSHLLVIMVRKAFLGDEAEA